MVSDASVSRADVFLVALHPSRGQQIQNTRPCVVISTDERNAPMGSFIVAPLTSGGRRYPFRIPYRFDGKGGHVVPDQLRTMDRERLVRRLGVLPEGTLLQVLGVLQEMVAPQVFANGPGVRHVTSWGNSTSANARPGPTREPVPVSRCHLVGHWSAGRLVGSQ